MHYFLAQGFLVPHVLVDAGFSTFVSSLADLAAGFLHAIIFSL
jgi:hypothetical protein